MTPDNPPTVGYLANHPNGVLGVPGLGHDYIMARDGLYVRAGNGLIQATMQIAKAGIPGLDALREEVSLAGGPIPRRMIAQGVRWMAENPETERLFAICLEDGRYLLQVPEQSGAAASLSYVPPRNAVAEFHSHGTGPAFFSRTDDQDEQGLRIYGVVGQLHRRRPQPRPEVRLGIYGHFGCPPALTNAFSHGLFTFSPAERRHAT